MSDPGMAGVLPDAMILPLGPVAHFLDRLPTREFEEAEPYLDPTAGLRQPGLAPPEDDEMRDIGETELIARGANQSSQ